MHTQQNDGTCTDQCQSGKQTKFQPGTVDEPPLEAGVDAVDPTPQAVPGRPPLAVGHVIAWVCLAAPFVALLWVGSYAKANPHVWGFPFFFWYQFVWVFLSAILTGGVYYFTRDEDRA